MDFKAQTTTLFQSLTLKQKIVILVSILLVVSFVVFLILFKPKDSMVGSGYSVLFERTSPSDSALIIQQLEQGGIPYKIINEGTIAVPSSMVYQQRISIAALGIPKDSRVGFEIFDQSEFGATDFEQKIKYIRALEGELSRTIEGLQPIDTASVHIAIPKETVFAQHKIPATASVALSIGRGMNLSQKQITGIRNLVAASIVGLLPEDVSIVDQNSIPLGDEDGVAFKGELVESQVRYKKKFERDLENKIINVLAPVIGGIDKVVAKVTIDFDFDRVDSVSEVYDPDSVPRSEQTVEEKREGIAPRQVGGVPGAVSNIGPVQGLEDDTTRERHEKSSSTINYEISKKITNIEGEFATIRRVSAAVVVDGNYELVRDEEGASTGELEFVLLSEDKISSIDDIVRQVVGFDAARGDKVTVKNFEFRPLQKDDIKAPTQNLVDQITYYSAPLIPILKYLLAGLLLFIFYKKVIEPFSRKMVEHESEEFSTRDMEAQEDDDEDSAEDTLEKFKKARKKVEDQLGIGGDFNEDELKYDVLLEKLKTLCDDKGEEISGFLQTMIRNESDFSFNPKTAGGSQ